MADLRVIFRLTMALGIQATISNIAVSRAFGALKVVASRTELERDPKLMRISSLQKTSIQ